MIVLMTQDHPENELQGVMACARAAGLRASLSRADRRTVVGVIGGDTRRIDSGTFAGLPGVARLEPVAKSVGRVLHGGGAAGVA